MDLQKVLDCIPLDLLIPKLYAYGFSRNSPAFINFYLKRQKLNVPVNSILNEFLTLLSGVP